MKHLTILILALLTAGPSIATGQSGNAAEIQAYLEKVNRGEAGVNPKDQSQARTGDPYAQARIQHRLANNTITAQANAGTITSEEAQTRRSAATAEYNQKVQAIEHSRARW